MSHSVKLSDISLWVLGISILIRLSLSNPTLDYFYPYTDEGGSPFLKIHPGTWMALLGCFIFILLRKPSRFLNDQFHAPQKYALYGFIALAIVMLYSLIRFGTSGAAYLVDTYLYAYICLFMMHYLKDEQISKIKKIILTFIFINSTIAIYEYLTGTTITPSPIQFGFFRSNALLGHPLNNALITTTLGLLLFGINTKPTTKVILWVLILLSLFAFGARASSAAFLFFSLGYFSLRMHTKGGSTYKLINRGITYALTTALATSTTLYLIFNTSIGSTIANRLEFDDSAMARVEAFALFKGLSVNDYFWGMGAKGISQATESHMNVGIIENFWLFALLQFGIPFFLLLYIPIFILLSKHIGEQKHLSWIIIFAFFIAGSTNNSLSVKTPALAIFIISIYFLYRPSTNWTQPKTKPHRLNTMSTHASTIKS